MNVFDLVRRATVSEVVLMEVSASVLAMSLFAWHVPAVLAIGGGLLAGWVALAVLGWERRRRPGGGER